MQELAREIVKQTEKIKRLQEDREEGKVSRRKKSQVSKSPAPEKK